MLKPASTVLTLQNKLLKHSHYRPDLAPCDYTVLSLANENSTRQFSSECFNPLQNIADVVLYLEKKLINKAVFRIFLCTFYIF